MPAGLGTRPPGPGAGNGDQYWLFEGREYPNVGLNAVVGRPREEWSMEPARFDQMRPGCFDIEARVGDMDIAGIWASLCFPSLVAGFCGAVFCQASTRSSAWPAPGPGTAGTSTCGPGPIPARIIPLQIPWLDDVAVAAAEVRANAAIGFRAVSFPEFPAQLGLPSIFTTHWDPFFAACEETGTVVCLHTGASAWAPLPSPGPPFELLPTVFPVNALLAAAEWVWSGVPARFPRPQDRPLRGRHRLGPDADGPGRLRGRPLCIGPGSATWTSDLRPSEVLGRNFWFCTIDDPSMVPLLGRIGDRPRDGGVRLPPRRLHVARHPGRPGLVASPASPRPPPQGGRGKRGSPLRPSPSAA